MISLATLSSVTLTAILAFALPCMSAAVTEQQSLRDSTRQFYARSHSLGHNYVFPARDGWVPLNVTDMQYKYSRSLGKPSDNGVADVDPALHAEDSYALAKRTSRKDKSGKAKKAKAQSQKKAKASKSTVSGARVLSAASTGGLGGVVGGALDNIKNALHGTGNPEPVIITWYTGHDLENPSCWAQSGWAPTDASFAAALTLQGWNTKPQCFKFLELCNGPSKCVFVRVVDTCAGCAEGSKHVDLTRGAFGELADFDQGVLTVQMRPATDPIGSWFEDLWGPKAN